MSRPAMKPRPADHLRLVRPLATAGAAQVAAPAVAKPSAAPVATRAFDWVWSGLGVGAATASAGFATYALVFSTGEVVPSGHFNLFARTDHLYNGGARTLAPPGATPPVNPVEVAKGDAVDFTPTGSVDTQPDLPGGGAGPISPGQGRPGPDGPPLPAFTLRDVFDGKALVESRASLSVVKPGSILDGAGAVLSIERRGERWVVLTENGVIGGGRR